MSMTFDVFPGTSDIPLISQVLRKSNRYINDYLMRMGIDRQITLQCGLHTTGDMHMQSTYPDDRLSWTEDQYAWFFVDGVAGGADCYFWHHSDIDKQGWQEDLCSEKYSFTMKQRMQGCIANNHYWNIRRSAGQPAIIVLAYGMVAAAIASETHGLVYSGDGAWDYDSLPAEASDFLQHYFRPEMTTDTSLLDFTTSCIQSLQDMQNDLV